MSVYNTPPSPVMKQEVKPARPVVPDIVQKARMAASQPQKPETQEVVKSATEEEVLTQAVPMSKPASSNGVKALWAKLLENISSFPSRAILKQQALPVKITQEEVILSIKNPSWLKQFGPEGTKHHFIVEASNSLFAGSTPKVIVRAPAAGDDKIRNEQQSSSGSEDESPAPAQSKKPLIQPQPEINDEEVKEIVSAQKEAPKPSPIQNKIQQAAKQLATKSEKTEMAKISSNPDSSYHTDNVNMVMDLFEGKFIE